ncbi:sodium-dependent transporter [Metabacillus litoralis]|uniref:sodium-dependent transporter n=1 Tax=Metabacillus litoralis TaxID=152268 RepID=UPI000EF5D373|nr:sodium-dependent transporter [Metabacillus litoralis]MCM3163852.1 sodium-dependent transporter [Metabacillus litoralis]MCM3410635.1 sodium-dependent transporter [Metabacillus litoralis]UHA58278.1 sodium-dependent transporter [Metabacillus litoralis]
MNNSVEQWSSKLSFILAAAGSAIGLGAIWKFPYVAGTSGGGVFFLIFILFTLLVGLPLLLGEFVIGRSTKKDAIQAYKQIAPNSSWHLIGRLGVVTCFILLSFYSVVGGWILIYLFKAVTGNLSGLTEQEYGELFGTSISDPFLTVFAQLLFLLITSFVVSKGVSNGIEKASRIMMPALFILFVILIVRSITLDGSMEGILFFLKPDFTNVTSETILYAMGQSFFALSVGVSVMVTYSSYLSKNENLPQSAVSIVVLNLLVAFLAGLAIFPAVFSFGLAPDAGPVLLFNVLPTVFNQMPFGTIFLIAFLLLFLFATLTSAFSMLEIIVAPIAKGNDSRRIKASWLVGISIFIVGIPSALSFGLLGHITLFDKSIFDAADFLVSNILMPLGALLISIFVPLKISKKVLFDELSQGSSLSKKIFTIWYLLLKYVSPIVIIFVFLDALGII